MTELRPLALLLAAALLGGCGLKGGLYLPEPETPAAETTAPGPGPTADADDATEDTQQQDQRGD